VTKAARWSPAQLANFEAKKAAVAALRSSAAAQLAEQKAKRHADPAINDQLRESAIQCAFIDWVHAQEVLDWRLRLLFAVPNGGKRGIKTAITMKAEGQRAGVCDILLPYPAGGFAGLAMEFKSKDGTTSDAQDQYMEDLQRAGWRVEVVRSTLGAIEIVKEYLAADT
jgi:hypothetical protein